MQIDLTPEQDDVVRHAIASGRIARPEDAVAQAMADWVEGERRRVAFIASLDEADAEHARGESIRIDTEEDARIFFDDIKATYRAILSEDLETRDRRPEGLSRPSRVLTPIRRPSRP